MANEDIQQLLTKLFEDKNGNGIPDAFEGQTADGNGTFKVFSTGNVQVNGKEYNGLEELPPEIKNQLTTAFSALVKNKWMGKLAGAAVNIMPEMNLGINKDAITATNNNNSEVKAPTGQINFSISRKWIYATLIIVGIFIVWVLRQRHIL
jgi:hypothetical protein